MQHKFDRSKFKRVTQDHREAQYSVLINLVTEFNDPERAVQLIAMYSDLRDRVLAAPASAKIGYHCAYEGGYLDHVLRVIAAARDLSRYYKKLGGSLNFSEREVVFAAMHHDLGKLGTADAPHYIPETDPYWLERGFTFKHNNDETFRSTFDQTILWLNNYNIKLTANELIGIRMANGMFDDGAKEYFLAPGIFPHKSAIGFVVHWADWMCSNSEKDEQRTLLTEDFNA